MRTTCLIRPSRLLPCLLLTVLALMSCWAPAAEVPPRKILILYSYHPGHPWTDKVRAAIQDTLRDSDVPVEVFSEYMDVRRAGNPDHLENLYRGYKSKYDLVAPDLVLACDDEALTLLAEHRQEFLPNVPLVYSGLHAPPVSVPGAVNVLQEIEYLATLELALRLRPRTHRIVAVVDGTPTALTHEAELLKLAPALETRAEIEILSLARYPMAEVRQQLGALHQDSVVLVLGHNRDRDGQTFTFPDAMRLLRSACPVPMYSVTDSRLGLGIVGGKLVSGYSQGCAAANTALRLLRGEHLTDEAARVHVENRYMFDYTELQHFSIPLSALPPDSEVINQPPTSYPVHLHDVLIVLNVVLALCIIIGLLLRLNLQRKRADVALRAKTDELNRFFDTNLDLLCIANTDGWFLRLSRQWENTLGHPLSELLAHRFLDFVHPDDVESTVRAVADLSDQKTVVDFVNRYRHQDGSYRWLEWRSLPVGNLIYAAARDITERKNAEEALHRSEEHLQALFQNMAEGVALHELLVDASGRPTNYRIIAINPQYERMLGLRSEDVIGRLATEVYATPEAPYLAAFGRVALSGHAERVEVHLAPMNKDFDISVAPWGEKGFATIFADITDRKRAEVALRESEERYRAATEMLSDYTFRIRVEEDGKAVIDSVSANFERITGRRLDEVAQPDRWLKTIHPEDAPRMAATLRDLVQRGGTVKLEFRTVVLRNGTEAQRWVEVHAKSETRPGTGRVVAIVGAVRDVTERKLAEEALRESEALHSDLIHCQGVGIYRILVRRDGDWHSSSNPAHSYAFVSDRYCAMFGLSREELLRDSGVTLRQIHPEEIAEFVRLNEEANRTLAPFLWEGRMTIGGVTRWIHFESQARSLSSDNVLWTGVALDITERKQAEEALREREERYRATLASMTDLVFVLDRAGRITDCHAPRLSDLYVPPATFLGKPFADVLPPSVADLLAKATDAVRAGSPVQTVDYELELKGRRTWWSANFSARWDGAGQYDGATIVAREVTERKLMEDHLRQTEKMTAIGQLAGGIAHDFNNQLTGILGYADMLAEVCADDEMKRFAKNIAVSARRAADLTQQLLAFGRKGKYLSVPVDIHRLLAEVVAILDRSIDKRIRISRVLRAGRPVTLGDPTQLQNALLNLALNARDAMPQGGDLTFETDVVTLGNADCQGSPYDLVPGEYLRVRIVDTGCGMSDEVKTHLFEPFFTTKQPGRGTGMGLASVYGAVRNHRGAISVDSALGRGTAFSILLPLAPEASDSLDAVESSPAAASVRATGRVLLVDDEASVRDVAGDMLRGLGYHVVTCVDGQEAVNYYRQNWQEIDLVILDMVMPVMGGRDAFLAMRRINPNIRAILSSGYSLDGEAQAILDEGVLVFVGKPYRQSELGRKVAEAMTPK